MHWSRCPGIEYMHSHHLVIKFRVHLSRLELDQIRCGAPRLVSCSGNYRPASKKSVQEKTVPLLFPLTLLSVLLIATPSLFYTFLYSHPLYCRPHSTSCIVHTGQIDSELIPRSCKAQHPSPIYYHSLSPPNTVATHCHITQLTTTIRLQSRRRPLMY